MHSVGALVAVSGVSLFGGEVATAQPPQQPGVVADSVVMLTR